MTAVWILSALSLMLTAGASAELSAGDTAWANRAVSLEDDLADPVQINRAIDAYRLVVVSEPANPQARWKLLRALHYAVDFTTLTDDRRQGLLAEAINLARQTEAILDSVDYGDDDRARLYFWSAIAFGSRARRVGPLTIVREGIAARMHKYAKRSRALDAGVEGGGAQRLQSRLHASIPRLPFVSGWVDGSQVLPLAREAAAIDPEHLGNRLILALALLDDTDEPPQEAADLLHGIIDAEPQSHRLIEDLIIQRQARARLDGLDGTTP